MILSRRTRLVLGFLCLVSVPPGWAAEPSDEHRQRTIQGLGQSLDESAAHYLRGHPGDTVPSVNPEVSRLRIAQQHGLGYLPLMIARQLGLIEKHARLLGLGDLQLVWSRYPSGTAMNDALQNGFLDIAAGGIGAMLRAWDRSSDDQRMVGMFALSGMPLLLNVRNPRVRTIDDFGERDRIALPSRIESTQAMLLRMAVAERLGVDHARALDAITVDYSHPQAMRRLLDGNEGVTAHFASPPFQNEELTDPAVHSVLTSHDILHAPFTFTLLWSRESFQQENPITVQALRMALEDAMQLIAENPAEAASIYALHSDAALAHTMVNTLLQDPSISFGTEPVNTQVFAERMYRIGEIRRVPANWNELFGPSMRERPGS